jgi:hypothetical protein
MRAIRLKINDKIYEKLLRYLRNFSVEEVEIIAEDDDYTENQKYLEEELKEINTGEAVFYSMDELNERLEKIINKHEDNL